MSKKRKRVGNTTKPKTSVKLEPSQAKISNLIYIDLVKYPNWTKSIKVGEFTNHFKDINEALRHFYLIINRIIPDIESYGRGIFAGKADHCHKIYGDQRNLAYKIIRKIHGEKTLDEDSELWELAGKTEEIRIIGTFVNESITIFYPLFIDHHHLLYPSKFYNQLDYKNYSYSTTNIFSK